MSTVSAPDPNLSFGIFLLSEQFQYGSAHRPAVKKGLFLVFMYLYPHVDKCSCSTADCRLFVSNVEIKLTYTIHSFNNLSNNSLFI